MLHLSFSGILVLALGLLLGACAPLQPDAAAPPSLSVAVLPITDVVPFYVAQSEGFFAEAGVDVELVPAASAAERDTLVQTGAADCELTDLQGVVLTNGGDALALRAVATARQATADGPLFFLLAAPQSDVTSVQEFAGRQVAISENTVIDYWLNRMAAAAGLDPGAIATTNVPQIPVRLELLLSGQIDGAVLPDPLASLARLQGARPVADDTSAPNLGVSVIVCRQDAIAADSEAVRGLVAGWDRAVEAINADPARYRNILIEHTRVPEPLQDQYNLPPFPVNLLPSETQVRDVVDWALAEGLIDAPLDYDQIVDATLR